MLHIFPVRSIEREKLAHHLTACGIQTLVHYPIPPHRQEAYREWKGRRYPIAEAIHNEELSLPLNPSMGEEECRQVAEAVNSFGTEV